MLRSMKQAVIYVPGLGDHRTRGQRLAARFWRLYGVRSEVILMHWRTKEPFETKLARLLARIDQLHQQGYQISLVGVSAGASAVINAFALRQTELHRVVCICGKLRRPETISPNTYRRNPAFAESMQVLPDSLDHIPKKARKRICSIKPLADELVPPEDTTITGAQAKTIISFGHAPSIGLAVTLYWPLVMKFLKQS